MCARHAVPPVVVFLLLLPACEIPDGSAVGVTRQAQTTGAPAASGEVSHLTPTSENKPPTAVGPSAVVPGPTAAELAVLVAKQQQYLQAVKVKLAGEWKGFSTAQLAKARAELKEQILGVQP